MAEIKPSRQRPTVPGKGRRWTRFLLAASLLLALWFALDMSYVSIGAEEDHAAHADVIIVLGCNIVSASGPSPCIGARTRHATDLYKKGMATMIIATGGPVENEHGPTESEALAYWLQQEGVPESAIIQENRALDTIQNIANSQAIMRQHNWTTAILVTEPFHINRATLIAHDAGMTVYPSPAVDSLNWQSLPARAYNVSRDALSLMLYQMKNLVGVRQ